MCSWPLFSSANLWSGCQFKIGPWIAVYGNPWSNCSAVWYNVPKGFDAWVHYTIQHCMLPVELFYIFLSSLYVYRNLFWMLQLIYKFRVVSHISHPFGTLLLDNCLERLYVTRTTACIPPFGLRMRNCLKNTKLVEVVVAIRSFLAFSPWDVLFPTRLNIFPVFRIQTTFLRPPLCVLWLWSIVYRWITCSGPCGMRLRMW